LVFARQLFVGLPWILALAPSDACSARCRTPVRSRHDFLGGTIGFVRLERSFVAESGFSERRAGNGGRAALGFDPRPIVDVAGTRRTGRLSAEQPTGGRRLAQNRPPFWQ